MLPLFANRQAFSCIPCVSDRNNRLFVFIRAAHSLRLSFTSQGTSLSLFPYPVVSNTRSAAPLETKRFASLKYYSIPYKGLALILLRSVSTRSREEWRKKNGSLSRYKWNFSVVVGVRFSFLLPLEGTPSSLKIVLISSTSSCCLAREKQK